MSPLASSAGSPLTAGQEAFRAGVKVGDNPFAENTDMHWCWLAGWVTAAGESRLKAKANDQAERPGAKG
jgi:hypothetical protein